MNAVVAFGGSGRREKVGVVGRDDGLDTGGIESRENRVHGGEGAVVVRSNCVFVVGNGVSVG
jgi:hypothetical protein